MIASPKKSLFAALASQIASRAMRVKGKEVGATGGPAGFELRHVDTASIQTYSGSHTHFGTPSDPNGIPGNSEGQDVV